MSNPSSSTAVVVRAPELKAGSPTDYDGNTDDAQRWLYSLKTYFLINPTVYCSEQIMVSVALSLMTKNSAKAWADNFYREAFSTNPPKFGTFAEFEKGFNLAFQPVDKQVNALTEIAELRMGNNVTDYISKFKTLATIANIKEGVTLSHFFEKGLNPSLREAIYRKETLPDTIEKWYTSAVQLDANYRRSKAVSANSRNQHTRYAPRGSKYYPKPNVSSSRDPNAMDVDRTLSQAEKDECYKKGLCFSCKEHGHRANDPRFHPKIRRGEKKDTKGKTPVTTGRDQRDDETSEDDMETNRLQGEEDF